MMTKNIKKSNITSNNKKPSSPKMQTSKKPRPKVNTSNPSTTIKTKSTPKKAPPKKGSKINLAITFFGLLLVLIVGTQLALNPNPTKATNNDSQTANKSNTAQAPSYPYFNNIDNTFSSIFLSELNNYRETKGLNELLRVRSITQGTTVTLQIPDIEQVAKNQNLDTETLLAEGVLHKFLESNNNLVVATATVRTIFLNTEVIDGTLNLTVTIPYEKSSTPSQNNNQTQSEVQPAQQQPSPARPQQQQQQQQPQQQRSPVEPEQHSSYSQPEPRVRHYEHHKNSESTNEATSDGNNSHTNTSNSQSDNNSRDISTSQSRQQ